MDALPFSQVINNVSSWRGVWYISSVAIYDSVVLGRVRYPNCFRRFENDHRSHSYHPARRTSLTGIKRTLATLIN